MDTCTFFSNDYSHLFPHWGDSSSIRAESFAVTKPVRQLGKLGKPSAFGLHLWSNAGALEVSSGENLPFLVCFFTIREYRDIKEHREGTSCLVIRVGLRSEVTVD